MPLKLETNFTERNELVDVRVDGAVFATGGGDLWTAWFSSPEVKAAATAEATRDGVLDAVSVSFEQVFQEAFFVRTSGPEP